MLKIVVRAAIVWISIFDESQLLLTFSAVLETNIRLFSRKNIVGYYRKCIEFGIQWLENLHVYFFFTVVIIRQMLHFNYTSIERGKRTLAPSRIFDHVPRKVIRGRQYSLSVPPVASFKKPIWWKNAGQISDALRPHTVAAADRVDDAIGYGNDVAAI